MENLGKTMSKDFWKGRRVLVTGHEGFLGSHLTRRLADEGARVMGLDLTVGRRASLFSAADRRRFRGIQGSVAQYRLVERLLQEGKVDTVFHLAAEAIVARAHRAPLKVFRSNITGTWNVLEACRTNPAVKALVVASSDKAYGEAPSLPYAESTPLQGRHPYDVSKSCADLIAQAYSRSYGLPVAVVRSGNIYGPGDFNLSRLIPDCVRCEFRLRSDGKFTRDYVYVGDVVEAYLALARGLTAGKWVGEAFNFGNEKPLTALAVVSLIHEMMGAAPRFKVLDEATYEIKHQYLDASKARRIVGWRPSESLESGMHKTIAWYRRWFADSRQASVR
jgi:CDP-glucose 4,6-dehydratase